MPRKHREPTYRIVRCFRDAIDNKEVVTEGLTLEQAKQHCRNPETSSRTATSESAKILTKAMGPWFDGYEEES